MLFVGEVERVAQELDAVVGVSGSLATGNGDWSEYMEFKGDWMCDGKPALESGFEIVPGDFCNVNFGLFK